MRTCVRAQCVLRTARHTCQLRPWSEGRQDRPCLRLPQGRRGLQRAKLPLTHLARLTPQVAVEGYQAAQDLDYSLLGGLWQLQYTTANDVVG
jgi:hypothetical protein